MKVFMFMVSIAMWIVCQAETHTAQNTLTAEEKMARRRAASAKRVAMSGGWVERTPSGKVIRIVNAQQKVPVSAIEETVASIKQTLMFSVEIVAGEAGQTYRPSAENPVVITLTDSGEDATLLVAPEQAWAVVNVMSLAKDSPRADVLTARAQKEVWRALALVLGASNSMGQPCLMRQINSLDDLDMTQTLVPCPEPFNFMISASRKLGIGRAYRTTYKRACQEGWAPAPTNDVQKAIFEQVKADRERGPTNPITIPPPNAKK